MHRDDLLDLLWDLQHDLGKYLRLPLQMLPADAPPGEVRAAVLRALEQTRVGPSGTRSAAEVWAGFVAEAGTAWTGSPAAAVLDQAVARALAWRDPAREGSPLDRGVVTADFAAVTEAIRALREEIEHGP